MTRTIAICSLFLFATACDKGSDEPTEAPADGGQAADPEATTEPGAPDVAWDDKTFQQRMEHMGLVVFPSMKEAFQGYDADRFADFKCQTCHGDDMKDVKYEMPNAATPLDPADPVADGNGIDEAMTKFMLESVLPKMKEHLAGHDVTCNTCHLEG
jgi:hypothetical protein